MNSPKPLYKLLSGEKSQVADLITTARRLRRLNQYILSVLDHPLIDHCQVARYEGESLVLTADSPVWASRLRYYIPTLLQQLKHNIPELQGLKSIKIHTAPAPPVAPESVPSNRHISQTAASNLHAMAESINDPALRAALLRLAKKHRE